MSFATTVPHIVLLNLDPEERDYRVVWEYNEKLDKWVVAFEEIEPVVG